MEVMRAEPVSRDGQSGFRSAIHGCKAKTPPSGRGGVLRPTATPGEETRLRVRPYQFARARQVPSARAFRSSQRGAPRDAHVAGTPLRGPATMDSRLRGNERSLQLRRSPAVRASDRLAQLHRAFEVDRDE